MTGWIKLHRTLQDHPLWLDQAFTRGQAWVDLLLLANHEPSYLRVRGNRIDIERGQVGWSVARLGDRWKWSRGKVTRFLNELEREQQIEQQKNAINSVITITNYLRYQQNGQQNGQQTDIREKTPQVESDNGLSPNTAKNSDVTTPEKRTGKRTGKRAADGQQETPVTIDHSVPYDLLRADRVSKTDRQTDSKTDSRRAADGQQTDTNKNDKNDKNEQEDNNNRGKARFTKPTPAEVEEYGDSIGFKIDGSHFVDYYETRGWMAGKAKMKDWKAAVRTWKHNQSRGNGNGQTQRRDFSEVDYGDLIDPEQV